jgi:hypothetical protein
MALFSVGFGQLSGTKRTEADIPADEVCVGMPLAWRYQAA